MTDNLSQNDPAGQRLTMPRFYQQAEGDDLLLWSYVRDRLETAENYWTATTNPDGRPHVTPVWGVFVDGALYVDGIPTSRWSRNLQANPAISIHLESGTDVVIADGFIEDLVTDEATGKRVVDAWNAKYGRLAPHPATDGIIRVQPRSVRAWTRFPHDATVWRFPKSPEPATT